MSMINQSKPTTSLANNTKITTGETWASITTTWATETRTWSQLGSFISNVQAQYAGTLWTSARFPWTETTPWVDGSPMSNISKPI